MTQNAWNAEYPSTDGQLVIGKTGARPVSATITAGAGIVITNGAGHITITNTGATTGSGVINRQVFTSSGTYTPTSGMMYCDVEVVGAGGAGGGAKTTGGAEYALGSGGGCGEYAKGIITAATIGASQAVTIGTGGTGVSGNNGNNGGDSSLGALITAKGGSGGIAAAAAASGYNVGGIGGSGGSGGNFRNPGQSGAPCYWVVSAGIGLTGAGGSGIYGAGGIQPVTDRSSNAGAGYGAGGSGSGNNAGQVATGAGGAGASGIIIVTEYISVSGGAALVYEEITAASKTIVVNFEYGANRGGGVAFTLPATAIIGTRFTITGISGLWSIAQGANQYIKVGAITSQVGVGGSVTATNASDCITCTCIETNNGWAATATMGNLTVVT